MSKLKASRVKDARREPGITAPSPVRVAAPSPVPAAAPAPAGNLQRARDLGHTLVQAKLTLGPADDPYERQADATASAVVDWLSSPGSAGGETATEPASAHAEGAVQRDDLEEDPEKLSLKRAEGVQRELVQRDDLEEDPEKLSLKRADGVQRDGVQRDRVQRDDLEEDPEKLSMKRLQRDPLQLDPLQLDPAAGHGPEGGSVDPSVESAIDGARSGGRPLDSSVREPMEQAFGADFGGVKIHDDARSHQLNRSLSARSFATGGDVFMGEGQYSPGTAGGQELLAHELTHVVQQGAAQAKRADGFDEE